MDSPRKRWLEKLPSVLALALGAVFAFQETFHVLHSGAFVASIDALCREVLTGSTVGRQALVGNLWFAPVPTLVHLVTRIPWLTLLLCHGAAVFFLWRFLQRHCRALSAFALYAGALVAFARFGDCIPAHFILSWNIVGVIALYTVLKLADWAVSRSLADWVLFSLSLAMVSLCGLRLLGWCAGVALLLPLLIATDKRSRPRLGGLLFLCYLPILYAFGSWLLMSRLIMGAAFYPWRFLSDVSLGSASFGIYPLVGGSLFLLALVLYCIHRLRPLSILAGALALALLWTGGLCGAGLKWTTLAGSPMDHQSSSQSTETKTIFRKIGEDVSQTTPYGRVFVCSHEGLGRPAKTGGTAFTPCLDLYIEELRTAYPGQQLYLLVPRPVGPETTHSTAWRYDGLYENGAEHLLFFADYGPWRLFQVVSAPLPSELQESVP